MRPLTRPGFAAALILSAGLLQGAGVNAAEYTVVIDKMAFSPVPARLQVGDVIVWQNNDILRHTVTARDESFDVDLPAKSEARMVIGQAGAVEFYCRFHPGMVGTLSVSP